MGDAFDAPRRQDQLLAQLGPIDASLQGFANLGDLTLPDRLRRGFGIGRHNTDERRIEKVEAHTMLSFWHTFGPRAASRRTYPVPTG